MLRTVSTLFAILLLVGCNGGAAPPPGEGTPAPGTPAPGTPAPGTPGADGEPVTVIVDDIAFQTASVDIAAGTEVTWVNEDAVGHTVTHGQDGAPVDDPLFDEPHAVGESVSFTFDEPGTYPVTCTIHPQMNMTVNVE